jgi:hypothetical protein
MRSRCHSSYSSSLTQQNKMATDALLSPGQAGWGGGGACMVKSFSHSQAWIFPLVLLLKLIAGELHFYTWKKALSPEWKGFPLWKHRKKELWGMEKTFQYHQQIFAGLELEIYNDLLKKYKIFLQCTVTRRNAEFHSTARMYLD